MTIRLVLIFLLSHLSFSTVSQVDSLCTISKKTSDSYNEQLKNARFQKQHLLVSWQKASASEKPAILDSIGTIFSKVLVDGLLPHWMGTKWTFEGHTNIPGQGSVACGYLVSTCLKHMGFNLNRYTLAQQSPKNEALSLAIDSSLIITSDAEDIDEVLSSLPLGIYFVGLDNHVGFLYKADTTYFIHSNYSADVCVMMERAVCSGPLNWSSSYFLVPLSGNRQLMRSWITGAAVKIIK